jgi:HTH-type transcriptional regulator / antitoxin HipB
MSTMVDSRDYTAGDLGRTLRAERRAQGLTQEALASRAQITRQTVIDLEKGKNVSVYVLMAVLAALGKALQVTDARPSVSEARALFADDEDGV